MDQKSDKNSCEEQKEDVILPGFRFHPTDEELVGFYLRRKVEKKPISIEIIKQIDIYKYDPWDLPKVSNAGGEKEWYFFCLRGRKYRNSIRPNRVTNSGFWKATGIDRPIYSSSNNGECIGLKKSLVYYRGSAGKGTKTDWMMHEFRLPSNPDENDNKLPPSMQEAEVWTICRIFKRNVVHKKYHYQQEVKESISKKNSQAQEQTSSITNNSVESDARDSFLQSSNPNYGISMLGSSSAWNNYQNSTAMNESLKDGNWDELGRIMGYFGDSNANFFDATNPN